MKKFNLFNQLLEVFELAFFFCFPTFRKIRWSIGCEDAKVKVSFF